jgi:hypothetical protein
MRTDIPGPEIEDAVGLFLDLTQPHSACRECIARTVELNVREVKTGLLRLPRVRGIRIETGCACCEGCGVRTAVVRSRPARHMDEHPPRFESSHPAAIRENARRSVRASQWCAIPPEPGRERMSNRSRAHPGRARWTRSYALKRIIDAGVRILFYVDGP